MSRTIHVSPRAGLNGRSFPYWQGERAEEIVGARIAAYPPRKTRTRGVRIASDDPQRPLKRKLSRYRRKLRQAEERGDETRIAHVQAIVTELEQALA